MPITNKKTRTVSATGTSGARHKVKAGIAKTTSKAPASRPGVDLLTAQAAAQIADMRMQRAAEAAASHAVRNAGGAYDTDEINQIMALIEAARLRDAQEPQGPAIEDMLGEIDRNLESAARHLSRA